MRLTKQALKDQIEDFVFGVEESISLLESHLAAQRARAKDPQTYERLYDMWRTGYVLGDSYDSANFWGAWYAHFPDIYDDMLLYWLTVEYDKL